MAAHGLPAINARKTATNNREATKTVAVKRMKKSKASKMYSKNSTSEKFAVQKPGAKTYGMTGGVVAPPVRVR